MNRVRTKTADGSVWNAIDLSKGVVARWTPIKRTGGYNLSLAITAAIMILLPLAYFACIGIVAWGVWLYISHLLGMDRTAPGGSGGPGITFLTLLPVALGAGLIVFLLKPLFAPRAGRGEVFSIERYEDERLYGFVDMMCSIIGAPPPRRIEISCDVNAAAGMRSFWSMFRRGDLILTIGMPLVAGMNIREFAGVLAHEFGHFTQGAAMRATYMTSFIRAWFYRAAYQRDSWDMHLWTHWKWSRSGYVRIFCGVLLLGIGAARLIIRGLFWVACAGCATMLRQMENDADRHQLRFVGSETFESIFRRLSELQFAFEDAESLAREEWQNGRLPDDLPALAADALARQSLNIKERVNGVLNDHATHFFASHPSTPDRIAQARALAEPGIFNLDAPAAALFTDFRAACRKATSCRYQQVLGRYAGRATLVHVGEFLRAGAGENSRIESLKEFVGFDPPDWRPLTLPAASAYQPEPRELAERWRKVKREQSERTARASAVIADFVRADERLQGLNHARAAFNLGVGALPESLAGLKTSRRTVVDDLAACVSEMADARAAIDPALDAAAARLWAAVRLLEVPAMAARLPDQEQMSLRARSLVAASRALSDVFVHAQEAREDFSRVIGLVHLIRSEKGTQKALEVGIQTGAKMSHRLTEIRSRLNVAAPGEEEHTVQLLCDRMIPRVPYSGETNEILDVTDSFLKKYPREHRRITAELVEIAFRVEAVLTRKHETA